MLLEASIEALIERHTQAAIPPFKALVTQLARAQAHEQLGLLNAVILSGPAYAVLHVVPTMPRLQHDLLIMHEIALVQQVPSILLTHDMDTLLDVALAHIVAPPLPLTEFPADKWCALLAVCTDLRQLALSQVIGCLCTQPLCPQQVPHTPEAQRALTFAVFTLTEHGLPVATESNDPHAGWQPYVGIHDPIARLSGLLALKSAVQRRVLPAFPAGRVLAALEAAWTA